MTISIMMKNVRSISHRQILMFDDSFAEQKFSNSLKEFIYYLRYQDIKGVIDFTYASHSDSIHPQLSVEDNFSLDSLPTSLIKNKEENLRHNIEILNNKALVELIAILQPLDRKASDLNQEEIKIASVVKAMLAQTRYIFLEQPDRDLSNTMLKLVKECLRHEVVEGHRVVLMKAYNKDLWLDLVTDTITRNQKKQYLKHPNFLSEITNTKEEIFTPTYNFTLLKKAI